jgi:hypothetical protein
LGRRDRAVDHHRVAACRGVGGEQGRKELIGRRRTYVTGVEEFSVALKGIGTPRVESSDAIASPVCPDVSWV